MIYYIPICCFLLTLRLIVCEQQLQRCKHTAEVGDHLLVNFSLEIENVEKQIVQPYSLYYFEISEFGLLSQVMIGSCPGDERKFSTSVGNFVKEIDLDSPALRGVLFYNEEFDLFTTIRIHLVYLTSAADYQVINALEERNFGTALKLINEEHLGINARDKFGMTSLMIAIINKQDVLIGTLLNSYKPRLDINAQNPQGYTALAYAVGNPGGSTSIVRALLKRGADPNLYILQPQSGGWTPLHFACRLADLNTVSVLLDFGANPLALGFAEENVFDVAEHAQTPYAFRKQLANLLNAALDKMEQTQGKHQEEQDQLPSRDKPGSTTSSFSSRGAAGAGEF